MADLLFIPQLLRCRSQVSPVVQMRLRVELLAAPQMPVPSSRFPLFLRGWRQIRQACLEGLVPSSVRSFRF